jgi:cellulose biosynthesis protein BcsQ
MSHDRATLTRVVAVANGKGGVGKTSLTASLGGLAAAAGYRVLLVDLDPQGNLGDDLGYIGAGLSDHGQHLAGTLIAGGQLHPVIPAARERLDAISGGEHLTDLAGVLFARHTKGRDSADTLATSLTGIAADYDLVLIDTPPIDTQLQTLALTAARWLLIPTKADTSSIRGLAAIADRVVDARTRNPGLEVLGVVLFDVPSTATRIRQAAADDITTALGGAAPLFDQTIRSSAATAREARQRGLLVHELAEKVEGSQPFWQALRAGTPPDRLPGTAPALAADYVALVDAILTRISNRENEGSAA